MAARNKYAVFINIIICMLVVCQYLLIGGKNFYWGESEISDISSVTGTQYLAPIK